MDLILLSLNFLKLIYGMVNETFKLRAQSHNIEKSLYNNWDSALSAEVPTCI